MKMKNRYKTYQNIYNSMKYFHYRKANITKATYIKE